MDRIFRILKREKQNIKEVGLAKVLENLSQKITNKVIKKMSRSKYATLFFKSSIYSKMQKNIIKNETCVENIELNLVYHCDLNCKFCSHFSCLSEEKIVPLEDLTRDLERLSLLLGNNLRNIKLIGGEPLLHPELEKIMIVARNYFPNSTIILVTNGVKLLKQPESFYLCCNTNNVSIAATKYPLSLDYEKIEATMKKYAVNFKYYNNAQVLKTMRKDALDLTGSQNPILSYHLCSKAKHCAMVTEGKLYLCAVTANVFIFNEFFQKELVLDEKDYLDFHEKAVTKKDVIRFLNTPSPFCKYCDFHSVTYNHQWETTKKDIQEWLP